MYVFGECSTQAQSNLKKKINKNKGAENLINQFLKRGMLMDKPTRERTHPVCST